MGLRKWWWVAVFCACAFVAYAHMMQRRAADYRKMAARLVALEQDTRLARVEKETLALRLASQDDPAWIELILLRQMGVVPEGFLKVHFKR